MTADPQRAKSIFLNAAEFASDTERKSYIEAECQGDEQLQREVEELLQHHEQAKSFLESPAGQITSTIDQIASEFIGAVIGPYKLVQQIGEGGMGVVYLAEQTEPVQRRVALKVIKPGMDSKQVIARFEAERQALAMMDHVNIARVIDGGTIGPVVSSKFSVDSNDNGPGNPLTTAGRPYFVMELINGVPITKYCDDNHLTPRERLELFVPVCQAIQHAHQKGIIHRDIKPSNVLVTLYDGKPVPKVIDFGVAKAIEQKLTDRTLFTNFGTMVGTLEYMSPEQADSNALGIDTRSDIYSLGVLLYELLTGSTPLTRKQFKEAANFEILRMIKEDEPPKPSTRLSESGDALASISAQRKMEPAKLSKLVRGELDWIVMKTLEKNRNRRYETANGLAVDLLRYLNDEAVLACPPSRGYRLRKFVMRNKGAVLAGSMVVLSLIAGMIGTSWQAWVADQNRQTAESNQQKALVAADAERKSKFAAQQSEAEVKAVLDFVAKKILIAARPESHGGLGNNVSLRKAIDSASPYIENSFRDTPLIEAQVRSVLGQTYEDLGDVHEAVRQLEVVCDLYKRHDGPDGSKTLASMDNLATVYHVLGKYDKALKLHKETLQLLTSKYGQEDIRTLGCMVNLSSDYMDTNERDKGLRLAETALAMLQENYPDHEFTFNCKVNVARYYQILQQFSKALQLNEELLPQCTRRFGADNYKTIIIMECILRSHLELGNYSKAAEFGEKVVEKVQSKLDADHPLALKVVSSLADAYSALERYEDALKYDEQSLKMTTAKFGPNDRRTFDRMNAVADDYFRLNRFEDALRLNRETLERRKRVLGPDDDDTLASMNNLGNAYGEFGQHDEARKLYQEALEKRQKKHGNDKITLTYMCNVARAYGELGRHDDAVILFGKAIELQKAQLGPQHPETLQCMHNLASMLANSPEVTKRDPAKALSLSLELITANPNAAAHSALGVAQYRMGNWENASASLMKSIQLSQGGESYELFFLAMCHWRLGHQEDARKRSEQAIQWMQKHKPNNTELRRLRAEATELIKDKEVGSTPK